MVETTSSGGLACRRVFLRSGIHAPKRPSSITAFNIRRSCAQAAEDGKEPEQVVEDTEVAASNTVAKGRIPVMSRAKKVVRHAATVCVAQALKSGADAATAGGMAQRAAHAGGLLSGDDAKTLGMDVAARTVFALRSEEGKAAEKVVAETQEATIAAGANQTQAAEVEPSPLFPHPIPPPPHTQRQTERGAGKRDADADACACTHTHRHPNCGSRRIVRVATRRRGLWCGTIKNEILPHHTRPVLSLRTPALTLTHTLPLALRTCPAH